MGFLAGAAVAMDDRHVELIHFVLNGAAQAASFHKFSF